MSSNIKRIREWFFSTFCHRENVNDHDLESNIQDVVIPIADDELVYDLDNAEKTEVKVDSMVTKTDKQAVPLSEDIKSEQSNNIVFDNVEPVSPLETTHSNEEVAFEQTSEEEILDESFSGAKLVSLTVDSIKYYDKLRSQMPTDDLKTILDDVCRNLIDNLVLAGCLPINEEPGCFDMTRHRVEPFQLVEEGTPYIKVLRKGVEYQNEVKLLAVVEL